MLVLLISAGMSAKSGLQPKTRQDHLSRAEQHRFDYYFYEAIRLRNEMKYDQAFNAFLFCLQLDSLNAAVLSEIGTTYANLEQNEQSIQYFEKSVQADPSNWWYNIQLATMCADSKKWDKAISTLNQLKKYYPDKDELYSLLATFYKENKEFSKAIDAFNKLEALDGIDQNYSFEKFRLYMYLNKNKKAIAEIDRLINKFPTESRYQLLRGDIYMQQKMPEKAFDIYNKILKEDPQNGAVYLSLSEYYNQKEEQEKAQDAIVGALKSDQLDVDTKMQVLGQYAKSVVQDSSKFIQTENLFKLLVEKYPLEEQVHAYYAMFLQYQKRYTEEIGELETIININPKNEQAWDGMIQIYLEQKQQDSVLSAANRAIINMPRMPVWYMYKSIPLFQTNNYQEAIQTCIDGLKYVSEKQYVLKSNFYSQIGDCYYKMNSKDSSFVNYEKALKANPTNMLVMNNYAYYLSLEKKDLKKAEKMSAKTIELEPSNSTYLDTYAWILYEQGYYSLAKLYIEKALDNRPKDEDTSVLYEHYGDILWMNKNDDKALEMWEKSLESGNKADGLKQKIENKGWTRDK